MPRTRMRSGGSREKKTRHLPTRSRSSPGRSLRDFTSPWPVAAKRTRAASIRAWTTRSRRAKSRTAAGRKTTRRITARAGVGLRPGGHIRTQTHGYKRTITLFAALNYLDGKILSRTETRHTHVEWLRFLKQIDQETPPDQQLHLIVDNYATHKHGKVRNWLKRHPRIVTHFTPTGSSWMNLVERFFADLTEDCVREGSFESVRALIEAIDEFLAVRNEEPKRYVWRAKGKISCARSRKRRRR